MSPRIFFFSQIFCKYHNLDEIKWKLLIHDYTQQQNNDKDCGVFCFINAYCFIFNKDILLKDSETLAARMWIAKKCLELQVTESFKKSDGLDGNKLEHVLESSGNVIALTHFSLWLKQISNLHDHVPHFYTILKIF